MVSTASGAGQAANPRGLRQSMASLHTWTGLLPGWIVFLVFLTGTPAFFLNEISAWMRPELHGTTVSRQALAEVDRTLASKARGPETLSVSLPNARGGDALAVSWSPPAGAEGEWTSRDLDPQTGALVQPRATRGGDFLFKFHYNLYYFPHMIGRYAIVIASLAMLVAILSGIITHKKIFVDFFMLRFGKGQRSWLDAHNVTSVLALPFHLMITYTGLVIFAHMLMPWTATASFPTKDAYFEAAYPSAPTFEASGRPAAVLPIAAFVARAEAAWGEPPAAIDFEHPGDAAGIAIVQPGRDELGRGAQPLYLNAATGAQMGAERRPSGAEVTRDVLIQLHAGWFAAPVLRWFYFLAGLSGTVMIATGLILWTVKRRAKLPDPTRPHLGFRLVERLNIGVIAGGAGGLAAYFLANRLLPIGLPGRSQWEVHSLFIVWGALFVWSIGRHVQRAWTETLAAAAALFALTPLVNAVTTSRGLLASVIARDWIFVGFDAAMLAMAGLLALVAHRVATWRAKAAPRRKVRAVAGAGA